MQNGKGALDVDGMKFGNKYLMTKDAPNTLYDVVSDSVHNAGPTC